MPGDVASGEFTRYTYPTHFLLRGFHRWRFSMQLTLRSRIMTLLIMYCLHHSITFFRLSGLGHQAVNVVSRLCSSL